VALLTQEVRDLKKQLSGGAKPGASNSAAKKRATDGNALSRREARIALDQAARALNVAPLDVPTRVRAILKDIDQRKAQLASGPKTSELSADKLLAEATQIGDAQVIVADAAGANPNLLRQLIDQVRKKAGSAAVLLASASDDKVSVVAGLTRDLIERGADAGRWVKETSEIVGGSGGGRPDMAQAGGKLPEKVPQALERARQVIAEMLKG
jgi:alanyl-tRNA synthetase